MPAFTKALSQLRYLPQLCSMRFSCHRSSSAAVSSRHGIPSRLATMVVLFERHRNSPSSTLFCSSVVKLLSSTPKCAAALINAIRWSFSSSVVGCFLQGVIAHQHHARDCHCPLRKLLRLNVLTRFPGSSEGKDETS